MNYDDTTFNCRCDATESYSENKCMITGHAITVKVTKSPSGSLLSAYDGKFCESKHRFMIGIIGF